MPAERRYNPARSSISKGGSGSSFSHFFRCCRRSLTRPARKFTGGETPTLARTLELSFFRRAAAAPRRRQLPNFQNSGYKTFAAAATAVGGKGGGRGGGSAKAPGSRSFAPGGNGQAQALPLPPSYYIMRRGPGKRVVKQEFPKTCSHPPPPLILLLFLLPPTSFSLSLFLSLGETSKKKREEWPGTLSPLLLLLLLLQNFEENGGVNDTLPGSYNNLLFFVNFSNFS